VAELIHREDQRDDDDNVIVDVWLTLMMKLLFKLCALWYTIPQTSTFRRQC